MSVLSATVIVPTYNRADLLVATLESVARQDVPVELVVVDDGSSDDTAEVVERYARSMGARYVFQEDRGYRVAAARNEGVRRATGNVCVFVDSGVVLGSSAVRAHLRAHQGVTGPAAVIGYVYGLAQDEATTEQMWSETRLEDLDATMDRFGEQGRWLDMRESFYQRYDDDIAPLPAPWLVYWTCNVSVRTDQLCKVGMFDEAFTTWGGEDAELGYRLHQDGATFVLARDARAVHLPHPKKYVEREPAAMTNHHYMVAKHPDSSIMRLLIADPPIDSLEMNELVRTRSADDLDRLTGASRTSTGSEG
ncbi:glycosyltransferase [Oerskovia enterophila]